MTAATRSLLFIILTFFCLSCARVSSPQGGPVDEIPPTLLATVPDSAQINYKGNTVLLQFDEWVKVNSIESNLVITPRIEGGFKTKVKKKSVLITFLKPLSDSTTYTLSFGNSIQDITNSNVPPDLRLSFSTGSYIDSLEISGNILDLYSQDPKQKTLVSLYPLQDSLDITTGPASYFTRTDSAGNYTFTNLPSNQYRLYATFDQNNNMRADTDSELYGFIPDTLTLDSNISNADFTIQRLNTKPLRVTSGRTFGKYFDIAFSKPIQNLELVHESSNDSIFYSITKPNTVRLYNHKFKYADTTNIIVSANDSLGFELKDTVSYYFIESKIQPDPFSFKILPEANQLQPKIDFELTFSKPIVSVNTDSIYFQLDSINKVAVNDSSFIWNQSKTKLTTSVDISNYIDPGQTIPFNIRKSAFISIDGDTSQLTVKPITYASLDDTGVIGGTISTNLPNFIVQLVSPNTYQVIHQSINSRTYSFTYLNAGTYMVRVVADLNGNGVWDTGNILTNTPPEPILYYYDQFNKSKQIKIRKNWELTDIDINYNVDN